MLPAPLIKRTFYWMRSLCIQVVAIPPTDPILRFWYVITQPSLSEKQVLHLGAKRKNQPSPLSWFHGPLWDLLPGRLALADYSPPSLQVSSFWLSTPPCQWGTHTLFPYYQHKKSKLQNIKCISNHPSQHVSSDPLTCSLFFTGLFTHHSFLGLKSFSESASGSMHILF